LTLKAAYDLFCQEAEQYQEFWRVMDELDERCCVLEPEMPSMSDTYRKIAVSMYHVNKAECIKDLIIVNSSAQNVSLKIEVEPKNPRTFPAITWFGSEAAVFVFREKAMDRLEVLK
jgi:E3 ubiquitin-protein ligase FANCL